MGYIIGGQKRNAIVAGTESAFKEAAAGGSVTTVPNVMPVKAYGRKTTTGGLVKNSAGYSDVTRTAPLFNDPRYTSSTLAIPTDNRTLNGLYRFFAETDPIVGAGLKIHCLPAGEDILTENGMKPVEQLTTLDKVIGKRGEFQNILATEKSLFVGDLYSIKLMGRPVSRYTDNHPFLVIKGKRIKTRPDSSYWGLNKKDIPQVVEAKDLKKGDFVLYPKLKVYKELPESIDLAAFVTEFSKTGQRIYTIYDTYIQRSDSKKKFTRHIKVNEDLAELFGWYVAEGCGAKDNSILHFSLSLKKEKEVAIRIQKLLQNTFGITATISERPKVGLIQVYTCSTLISKFFSYYCGNGSHNVKIPDFIMYSSNTMVKTFLKAYFAGDGCKTDKYDIHIVTVSETLAFQLVRLASKLDVFLRLRPRQKDIWIRTQWYIDASNISFYEKVLDKKVVIKAKQPTQYQEDENYFYIPVKKVSFENFEGDVYDIRTEDSWFLHHCIIHNSELPVADLALGTCEDEGVQKHYDEMWERINGTKLITDIVSEYHEIGDCVAFGAFNETDYMWDQFAILNPDYVKIESTWINQKPLIKLIPDDVLKRIVQTQSPRYIFEQLPPEITRYVLFNQEIPLAPNNTFHIAYAKRPYEPRGRSLIKRIIKVLMLEDRFMQAEFALATRHAVPLTIVKLGDQNSVEEDHLVVFKENEELKIMSFEKLWNSYDGAIQIIDNKEIKDVSSYNLYTQSLDSEGNNVWNKIYGILRHPTPDKVVKINTPVANIRTTEAHGLVRLNPDSLELEYVIPEELKKVNSTIVTMDKFDYSITSNMIFGDIELTESTAYLIGLWTADGNINKVKNPNTISICNFDKGIQEYVLALPTINKNIEKVTIGDYVKDVELYIKYPKLKKALVKYYNFTINGVKTGIEKVPNEILFNTDNNIVGAFFAGVIDGDGWLFKDSVKVGISCGASNEYHHMLSLALLSKGIVSRVRSTKENYYELKIDGKDNLEKIYNMVLPYLKHSKKKVLCQRNIDSLGQSKINDYITNVFKVSDDVLFNMFSTKGEVLDGAHIEKPLSFVGNLKYLSKKYIDDLAEDCYEKERLQKFYGIGVYKVEEIDKSSNYVYDLMLKADHTYLTAGEGWLLTHNSGWIPGPEEMDEVRDMMCYSEDTEVLTENGFKLYKDVKESDRIACFDKNTNELIYHFPIKKYDYAYEGDMINFNSKSIDMLVTPNHRMFGKNRKKEKWEVIQATDVTPDYIFRACIDSWKGNASINSIKIGKYNVNLFDLMELAGWYLSEGSLSGKYENRIYITQMKDITKKIIETLLNKLPWNWNYHQNNFVINDKSLYKFLNENFGKYCQHKKIANWIKNLSMPYLDKLFTAYSLGDGYDRGKYETICCTTSSKLADDVQEIAFKLGYAANIKCKEQPIFWDPVSGNKYKVRPRGPKKGEPYFKKYEISCTTHNRSKFPGLAFTTRDKTGKYEINIDDIKIERKGKRILWEKLDLKNLLEKLGSAYAVGNFLGVTGECVQKQLHKQKIKAHKPGQRNPVYTWATDNKNIKKIPYKGNVWCFTVPTGLFITRRNGRLAVQGNSAYELDPNFSIVYHWGIDVQYYGSNGKMLPVGPELDRMYRLKFIGMGIHEQLLTGAGGNYSQAYVNMEIQRQRYLNLQLKVEQMVHTGWFKVVADLCGFYKVRNATAGYGGVKNYRWGSVDERKHDLMRAYSSLRDFQDNTEFKTFITRKAEEQQREALQNIREYVYPELDWGGMSAANDENLKNYIKWLVDKRPYLVDDATLAKLGKLDRDKQEDAYVEDLKRAKQRYKILGDEGLLPFIQTPKGSGGGDFGGGIADMGLGGGGGADLGGDESSSLGGPAAGGAPPMPIGAGGPPETAAGAGAATSSLTTKDLRRMEKEISGSVTKDDLDIADENKILMKRKAEQHRALVEVLERS